MPIIWNDSLSTVVITIDNQHEEEFYEKRFKR